MGLMDILQQYTNGASAVDASAANTHFDQVASAAPTEVLGQGVADAFRADSTPSFGSMVGQMFGQSNPEQRAGVLNELMRSLGPGVLAALGGSLLGRLSNSGTATASAPQVTPDQAARVTPAQVQEIAARAEQHNPGVLDQIGSYYAQHPDVVKTLGSAALAIALAGVASRMRR